MMAIEDVVHAVTSVVARATRATKLLRPHPRLTQLARPHLARGASFVRFLSKGKKGKGKGKSKKKLEDGVLWRRTILMGEKCDPLAFSGVIHYDSDGNRVVDPPVNSPLRSSLPAFLLLLNLEPGSVHPEDLSWRSDRIGSVTVG